MASLLTGVHHVTAFAKDPRETLGFYTRVLGLRLVKRTVNFDDPSTYHLYFGDERGTPGTLLTHFPHPHAKRGEHGAPEITETVLAVARGSLDAWRDRLRAHGVGTEVEAAFGAKRLRFEDPHGMRLALVEREGSDQAEGIGGVEGVRIDVVDAAETGAFLTEALGFESVGEEDGRVRFRLGDMGGDLIELARATDSAASVMGAGTVHHVAWRVPDDQTQLRVSQRLRDRRVGVTQVLDRKYFRSIYFRVPGGVIFELATDGPGFAVDEPLESLGASLQLPGEYETRRGEIEGRLIPLEG